MFSTTLLLPCKFLTTFIIFGYCAHRCTQVRTGAAQVSTTHYSDYEFNWETNLETCFPPLCYFPASFDDNFHNFWILCAQVRTVRTGARASQVRTGAHKCAHTLFRHEFNWETTWKPVFHHFAISLQVFDNFHNFWILCAQVRTGAHRCAQVRTHTIQT